MEFTLGIFMFIVALAAVVNGLGIVRIVGVLGEFVRRRGSLNVLLIVFCVTPQAQAVKNSKEGRGGLEQEITVTMPIPGIQLTSCETYISLQSHQRNTQARVVSTIEPKTCKTSTGEYELQVTVKDGNGDLQTLKFSETWEQKDDSQLEFSNDYPIGENVTLKRVMAQGLRCECSDE